MTVDGGTWRAWRPVVLLVVIGAGSLGGNQRGPGAAVSLGKKRKARDGEEKDEEARSNSCSVLHRAAGA